MARHNNKKQGLDNFWQSQACPKHKLFQLGTSALTDAELLALILNPRDKDGKAITLGRDLLVAFNGLSGIARASIQELAKIKGISKEKAIRIRIAFELTKRKVSQEVHHQKLNSAKAVYQFLHPTLADLDHEVFYVLYLNRNHELKSAQQLFKGGVNATVIDTRIIFKEAVCQLASSIILVHNHPSGNLSPSGADRNITKKCQEAGKLFNIPVLDHLIISSRGYYSFANSGEM